MRDEQDNKTQELDSVSPILESDPAEQNMLAEEQPVEDTVDVIDTGQESEPTLKEQVMEQAAQATEKSEDSIKFRDYKVRQMEEYSNDYSISQVKPSGWVAFLNIFNTVLVIIALALAFLVAFGLLFGLKPKCVTSGSMEPDIHVGSLVIVKPVQDFFEIQKGDVINYNLNGENYTHKVQDIDPVSQIVRAVGVNPALDPNVHWHDVDFRIIEGKVIAVVPVLGYIILWIKDNLWLAISIVLVIAIALMLVRKIAERKHAESQVAQYLEQKKDYEEMVEREIKERKKKKDQEEMQKILGDVAENGIIERKNTKDQEEMQKNLKNDEKE